MCIIATLKTEILDEELGDTAKGTMLFMNVFGH